MKRQNKGFKGKGGNKKGREREKGGKRKGKKGNREKDGKWK